MGWHETESRQFVVSWQEHLTNEVKFVGKLKFNEVAKKEQLMSSIQALKNGDLNSALTHLKAEVRNDPSESKHRIFLFQLLCILGEWDRALTQLNVAGELSNESTSMAETYQEALNCEALRAAVFAGRRAPLLFGEPEPWMAMMFEALKLDCLGSHEEGQALREQALEQAPTVAGKIFPHLSDEQKKSAAASDISNEIAFEWIADADSRIGPFLEAIVHGKYFWIPFQHIRIMLLEKATDLRDLVWLPARWEWKNGGEAVGFVPTRYAGSERATEDHIRLGWKTTWTETTASTFAGAGQRIFTTDLDEYPLTRISKIEFHVE